MHISNININLDECVDQQNQKIIEKSKKKVNCFAVGAAYDDENENEKQK